MKLTIMPFGLATAPFTFEALMEKVFQVLIWEKCALSLG